MKTKIIGLIYKAAALYLVGLLLFLIYIFGGNPYPDQPYPPLTPPTAPGNPSLWLILLPALFAVFLWILGSAIRKHRQWSWFAGMIFNTLPLGMTLFLVHEANLTWTSALLLIIEIFIYYSFLSEKRLFFTRHEPPSIREK